MKHKDIILLYEWQQVDTQVHCIFCHVVGMRLIIVVPVTLGFRHDG